MHIYTNAFTPMSPTTYVRIRKFYRAYYYSKINNAMYIDDMEL